MTVDQQIQIWNAVGTWLAGFATLFAVCLTLYLTVRQERVRLQVSVAKRLLIPGDGRPAVEVLQFHATNIGDRPVTITSIGWTWQKGKNKQAALQNVGALGGSDYPIELAHGKSASFLMSWDPWAIEFANRILESGDQTILASLRGEFSTSVNQTVSCKPEKSMLRDLASSFDEGTAQYFREMDAKRTANRKAQEAAAEKEFASK